MIYLHREGDTLTKGGIYFYRLSDPGSIGFKLVTFDLSTCYIFRCSKKSRKWHYTKVMVG